jgi:hypothetical protein
MKDEKTTTYRPIFIKIEKDTQEHINEDGKHRWLETNFHKHRNLDT